jgi:large subunit ribosomal protein L24
MAQSNGKKLPKIAIKKGDTVKVVAGKDKGAEGKVIKVLREEQRVIVEGVNRIKKHTKVVNQGGRAGTTGGIITTEAPIHVSNVMLVEGDGVTRIAYKRVEVTKRRPDGSEYESTRSVRISRKTGKEI